MMKQTYGDSFMNINKKLAMLSLLTAVASSAAFAMPGKEDEISRKSSVVAAKSTQISKALNAEKAKIEKSTAPEDQARTKQLTKVITKTEERKIAAETALTAAEILKNARTNAKAKSTTTSETQKKEGGTATKTSTKTTETPLEVDKQADELTKAQKKISELEADKKDIIAENKNIIAKLQSEKSELSKALELLMQRAVNIENTLNDQNKTPEEKIDAARLLLDELEPNADQVQQGNPPAAPDQVQQGNPPAAPDQVQQGNPPAAPDQVQQ
ncbi:MAG: hypothetical protein ACRC4G_00115 [Alphaproteobacteria bacterium]